VEAKEGLPIRASTDLQGSITFQTLFQFYPKLAGMTVRARARGPGPHSPPAPCCRPALL
jgi:preprotein translocase subunit SecA